MTAIQNNLKPLESHQPIREELISYFKDLILSGKLHPGDRIVETQWARALGISQSPVREALRSLESMGLVYTIPYQGTYVSNITFQDLIDAHNIRANIESLAVHYAIKLISDEDLDRMHILLDEMETAAQTNDISSYVQKDTEFHRTIVEASQKKMLLRIFDQCNVYEWTYYGTRFSSLDPVRLAKRHDSIYEALSARNEEKAKELVVLHLQEIIEMMRKQLAEKTPITNFE